MRLRRIAGTVLFFVTGILIFCGISEALRRKTAEATDMVHSFYEIEEDTLDVLFLGSSHLYYGVQPNELWRDYGIASCNGESGADGRDVVLSFERGVYTAEAGGGGDGELLSLE